MDYSVSVRVSLFFPTVSPSFSSPWQGETVPSMQSQHALPPKKHLRDTVSCEQTWLWSPPRIQTETRTKTLRGSDSGLILHVLTKWQGKPSRWRSGNRPKTLSVLPVLHTCLLSFFFVHTYIKAICLKREIEGIEEVRLDLMPALAFDAHLDDTCERLKPHPQNKEQHSDHYVKALFSFQTEKKDSIKMKGSEKNTIKEQWLFVFAFAKFPLVIDDPAKKTRLDQHKFPGWFMLVSNSLELVELVKKCWVSWAPVMVGNQESVLKQNQFHFFLFLFF